MGGWENHDAVAVDSSGQSRRFGGVGRSLWGNKGWAGGNTHGNQRGTPMGFKPLWYAPGEKMDAKAL
ncbi:hypothetical protein GCM10009555_104180 [Acrocarpospora macrocephala]|uniref:Uncharacterized protein n=1 Tax=Acrocarpospora macrocephala TaxID=150177 RepID=A0A5M3X878_9ACTN|nr:hypothetical protein Amac_104900 [Acrocarpospora macrocephala]